MQDKSTELFLGREYDYWIRTSAHIRVWPWDVAPTIIKEEFGDGDEDGIAWIPNEFLMGETLSSPISQLWRNDDSPELIRFRDGLLVIWRHG